MIVLRSFRKCSILLPNFDEIVRTCENFSGIFENCQCYRNSATCVKFCPKLISNADDNEANTGVRWVHITTNNETSKKCARPDNKIQQEMNLLNTHHTVLLLYDPSWIMTN